MNLFDHAEQGRKLRDIGLEKVTDNNLGWVSQAKQIALLLAAKNGEVTIEDVLRICPRPDDVHKNATGAVMRDKHLKLISYRTSGKASSHARRIGVYVMNEFSGFSQ